MLKRTVRHVLELEVRRSNQPSFVCALLRTEKVMSNVGCAPGFRCMRLGLSCGRGRCSGKLGWQRNRDATHLDMVPKPVDQKNFAEETYHGGPNFPIHSQDFAVLRSIGYCAMHQVTFLQSGKGPCL